MKKLLSLTLPLLFFAFCVEFTSCVPTRKLKQALSKIDTLKQDSSSTHANLNACNANVKQLLDEKKGLQNEKAGLIDEKTGLMKEKAGLLNEKAGLQNEKANIQNELYNLSTTSTMTIEDQAKRLKSLQSMIQAQKDALNGLKQTISDALINFKADELSVTVKDGNVYVSLEEKLLFKSGSADIDPKGKQALGKLATVLNNTNKDINVMIEGHTDILPIKSVKYEDNWALSSARALSIVRILTKDNGFDPSRIIGAARGEFHPVKTNDTPEGRASNRRTEIILSPNLTELFKLLNQ